MFNPEQTVVRFDYKSWREKFLRVILYVTAAMGLVAILFYVFTSKNLVYNLAAGAMYFVLLLFTFLKMPHEVRAGFFLFLIYIISASTLLDTALSGGASLFFLGWIALAALIISPLAGWIVTGVSLATLAVVGWLFLSGNMAPWTVSAAIGDPLTWTQTGIYILLLATVIVRGIELIQKEFVTAERRADTAFQNLRHEQANLANRIAEATAELSQRTKELEAASQFSARRAIQFEAISEVASSIGALLSMDELLPRVTEVISEQFGFYHIGIFLKDAENQFAVLMAANSLGGKKMLLRNHKLRIGEQGIVGYVTQTGLPRVALNVGEDVVFFNNPDLPDTRSEMALPLSVGGQTIGALDVQSTEEAAFDQEDVRTLTVLANQIGLVIENTRLFEQTRRSLAEAEALSRQYVREGWGRLSEEESLTGFQFTDRGLQPLPAGRERGTKSSSGAAFETAIALRGQTIGALIVRTREKNQLTPDQIDIIKAVADRVALSAENARLFEETSRRAEREQTVSQITTNIRSSADPQTMLQVAIAELKQVLGAGSVEIRPYVPSESLEQEKPAGTKRARKRTP